MIFKSRQHKESKVMDSSESSNLNKIQPDCQGHLQGLNSFIINERESKNLIGEEIKESKLDFQSCIPLSKSNSVPPHFSNIVVSPPLTSFPLYPLIEEIKETKIFHISKIVYSNYGKVGEMTQTPREVFLPFSDFKMSHLINHLQRPSRNHHEESSISMNSYSSTLVKFNQKKSIDKQSDDNVSQIPKLEETK